MNCCPSTAKTAKLSLFLAGVLGASGVGMGAYQAHGLEKALIHRGLEEPEVARQLHNCEVGVRYQMFHALALLGVAALHVAKCGRLLSLAVGLFTAGVVMFSGGLYLPVFAGSILHWAIVPLGGLLLIGGWVFVAISACSLTSPKG